MNKKNININLYVNNYELKKNFYLIKGVLLKTNKDIFNNNNIELNLPIKQGNIETDIYDENKKRICISAIEKNDMINCKISKVKNNIDFIWIAKVITINNKYELDSNSGDEILDIYD